MHQLLSYEFVSSLNWRWIIFWTDCTCLTKWMIICVLIVHFKIKDCYLCERVKGCWIRCSFCGVKPELCSFSYIWHSMHTLCLLTVMPLNLLQLNYNTSVIYKHGITQHISLFYLLYVFSSDHKETWWIDQYYTQHQHHTVTYSFGVTTKIHFSTSCVKILAYIIY